VLLNSCEGARGSEHDAFSSTAASLVRPGIPAVLANQYEISDEAAVEFSRAFYEAVADGLPLDAAVAGARTSLKIELGDTLEWGTPVLYMRSPDGRIFDIRQARDWEEERRKRLEGLYDQARRSHRDREWEAVVDVFDQIHALDPAYPDPEGLLASARAELAAAEQERRVAALYDQGLRYMETEEWPEALECFEEVQRLKPGYQDTERLLSRARQEEAERASSKPRLVSADPRTEENQRADSEDSPGRAEQRATTRIGSRTRVLVGSGILAALVVLGLVAGICIYRQAARSPKANLRPQVSQRPKARQRPKVPSS
jgi:tetratricopeptide (TPR) repeat protein